MVVLIQRSMHASSVSVVVWSLTGIPRTHTHIGGFRDTYLGRQVVLRPGGPRAAGMGSARDLGALRAPLAGSVAEPQPKLNLLPFSLKISHQVATISIIFNAMQTTNFKVKNIWGGNASPCL